MGICKDVMDQVRQENWSSALKVTGDWILKMIPDPVYGVPIVISFILFLVATFFSAAAKQSEKNQVINKKIKKDQPKVVDTVPCGEIENIAEFKDGKLVMCRCWKSNKFPYCDGSHNEHNKTTGDNVGPLIISKPTK